MEQPRTAFRILIRTAEGEWNATGGVYWSRELLEDVLARSTLPEAGVDLRTLELVALSPNCPAELRNEHVAFDQAHEGVDVSFDDRSAITLNREGWPERTRWRQQVALTPQTRRRNESLASLQEEVAQREAERAPLEPPPGRKPLLARALMWARGQRCSNCGQLGGIVKIPAWRRGYYTYRCAYCLHWDQESERSYSGT